MMQFKTEVLDNRGYSRDYLEMKFRLPSAAEPQPGQFLTLRISNGPAPLLRRPFAFASYRDETATIIFQRRGPGTELMAGKREGDSLDIIAPLGNSWPPPHPQELPVLIAGGIGIGPILFLASRFRNDKIPFDLVIGARSAEYLPREEELADLDAILATDDGSRGKRGSVMDALPEYRERKPRFYACGPYPMVRAAHQRAIELDAPCHVSMEQTMGCGVGACMGCVIPAANGGYTRVCADGPIFDSRELKWT